jgi:tetratricopeptide (TPR) repeat protein
MKWATVLVLSLVGCVYYNGMYNANRLANSARKAERDGRTFEATSLWGQVATKAESVVVRHPTSKYAEEAAILRGVALARMGQCEPALSALSRVAVARVSTELSEEAWLATGRCQVTLGNIAAADVAFARVLDSKNAGRRRESRFQRARTLRYLGNYAEAIQALEGNSEPRAARERLLSLAGAGQLPAAMALADSLIARGDTAQPWDSLVTSLGQQNAASASLLVDRLRGLSGRSPEIRARWLLEDGLRLMDSDTARASSRYKEAIVVGGSGAAAGRASLELARLNLRTITEPRELSTWISKLRELSTQHQVVASDIMLLSATLAGVLAASDSSAPGSAEGDLRLFLAGETARDSLQAPRLAETIFIRILNEWPDSPYAPKAVLAAQQLNPVWADSARALLETRYISSPYLAMIRGEDTSAYRQLEDSLGAFATTQSGAGRRGTPGRSPRTPPAERRGDEDEAPRTRPQPAPTVRVVEPQ